jgi:hypothetical protein
MFGTSGLVNALVVVAVVGLVIARQLKARTIGGGRWWLVPGVLAVLAIRDGGGLVDRQHHGASIALLPPSWWSVPRWASSGPRPRGCGPRPTGG